MLFRSDTKQLCVFATRIVSLRSTHITLFTTKDAFERARREVASEMKDSPYLNLIRWVVGACSRLELFTNAQHTRRFDSIGLSHFPQNVATTLPISLSTKHSSTSTESLRCPRVSNAPRQVNTTVRFLCHELSCPR